MALEAGSLSFWPEYPVTVAPRQTVSNSFGS